MMLERWSRLWWRWWWNGEVIVGWWLKLGEWKSSRNGAMITANRIAAASQMLLMNLRLITITSSSSALRFVFFLLFHIFVFLIFVFLPFNFCNCIFLIFVFFVFFPNASNFRISVLLIFAFVYFQFSYFLYSSHTSLLERRKCWGKSILPRARYRLGAYSTVDIFNFSHFWLAIL